MPPPKKAKGSPPIPAPSRYDSAERARIVEAFGRIDTAEGRTELRALIGTLVTRGEMDKPVAEVLASLVANQARDKGAAKPPSTASVALRLRPEAESDEVDLFDPPADMLPQ